MPKCTSEEAHAKIAHVIAALGPDWVLITDAGHVGKVLGLPVESKVRYGIRRTIALDTVSEGGDHRIVAHSMFWPESPNGGTLRPEDGGLRATFSASRASADIAVQITKKVIMPYLAMFDQQEATAQKQVENRAKCVEFAKAVGKALGNSEKDIQREFDTPNRDRNVVTFDTRGYGFRALVRLDVETPCFGLERTYVFKAEFLPWLEKFVEIAKSLPS